MTVYNAAEVRADQSAGSEKGVKTPMKRCGRGLDRRWHAQKAPPLFTFSRVSGGVGGIYSLVVTDDGA